jgi:hypothetical protein
MVFCLEKESRTISRAAFDAKNNCYIYLIVRYVTVIKLHEYLGAVVAELVRQQAQ